MPPSDNQQVMQKDVDRTCQCLSFFQGCGGRQKLKNILSAWVVYDSLESQRSSAIGYVQGMNVIVTTLLWHSGDEEACFWVFVAMMKHYDLRFMFAPPDMPGLKMRMFTLLQLVQQEMPDLSVHLAEHLQNKLGVILSDWLLSLFAGFMPLDPLGVLWDSFFKEGFIAIYHLILARLRCLEPWLLAETDFGRLVYLIKFTHVEFDWSSSQPKAIVLEKCSGPACDDNCIDGDELIIPESSASGWTCLICNGSEACVSWETFVVLLLKAETTPVTTVMQLERMFNNSRAPRKHMLGDSDEPKSNSEEVAVAPSKAEIEYFTISDDGDCGSDGVGIQSKCQEDRAIARAEPCSSATERNEDVAETDTDRLLCENHNLRFALAMANEEFCQTKRLLADAESEIDRLRRAHESPSRSDA